MLVLMDKPDLLVLVVLVRVSLNRLRLVKLAQEAAAVVVVGPVVLAP